MSKLNFKDVILGWNSATVWISRPTVTLTELKWSLTLTDLLHVMVVQQMKLSGLEAVLTFTFIKNVRLKFVTRTRRLLPRHVSARVASLLPANNSNTVRSPALVPPALNEGEEEGEEEVEEEKKKKKRGRRRFTLHICQTQRELSVDCCRHGCVAWRTTSGDSLQNKTSNCHLIFKSLFFWCVYAYFHE